MDSSQRILNLADSKKISQLAREKLYDKITQTAITYSITYATVEQIDKLNILNATLLAMKLAIEGLAVSPQMVLVDGNKAPAIQIPVKTIVRGDVIVPVISAASILAKVARDVEMVKLDKLYPHYGFAKHKGYGTAMHIEMIKRFGPCKLHRRSFAPVKDYFAKCHVVDE